ncbi:protein Shroom4 isoform X2 [Pithys albifrons albifrons]|uniref:protein Shroom4 isoform X2 n=1 Tax=Pithys albifrons albifrons TaxID=3385563 RepID=UPI003A5D1A81
MERAEGRPGAPQYVHVQLQGGAPWGFTLRGGLEHGEPLIVSKVEDGGKAALSRRLQPGDELVNISGTPLYGSRQEALILIKGSYRTLKMIVRRRSVPVLRPHSWHVAKLAESRPDAPTMHCPADAFSLSWPSGCDVSSRQEGAVALPEPARSCLVPLPLLPELGGPKWLESRTPCVLCAHSPCQCQGNLGAAPKPRSEGQVGAVLLCAPLSWGGCMYRGVDSWDLRRAGQRVADTPNAGVGPGSSELSLQWNPLSRHCSTDRSSSIGSMESLDHPGQAYYEGDPSPVDQGMYHSKRDSAYSSFSASSVASDCALSLRPEEAVSTDSSFQGPCKAPDGHYLTTGAEPSASRHPEAWRAPVPPQPPVRRDSLRAAPASRGDRHRVSVSADMLHAKGRWISDTFLCQRDGEAEAVGGRTLVPYPTKDRLSADQYYMLSSHPDRCPAEPLLGESMESDNRLYLDGSTHRVPDATAGDNPLLSPLKGHVPHRHSAPEQLLASQLRSLQVGTSSGRASPAPDGHRWTLSPLHPEDSRGGTAGTAQDPPLCPEPCCRPAPCHCCPELQRAFGQDGRGASPALSTEGPAEEESRAGARRAGGPPHRSAQMRRRSDRFATSLRNEIQRRKAQLQKSRGPGGPPPGEEPVEETEEPPESNVPAEGPPALAERLSPAPSEDGRSAGRLGDRGIPTPDPLPAPKAPPSPERAVPTARGRWRWSPERKLQPQRSPSPSELEGYAPAARSSPPRGSDEPVLLPFADRRRFFEESSRPAPPHHSKPSVGDPGAFQPHGPEHRDVRRLSVDQTYSSPSPTRPGSAGPYAECCREQPPCYKPLGRPGELGYMRGYSYPYGVPLRPESCRYCGGDPCPPPLPRGRTCRCHPQPWVRCPDCCCPAPRPGREESDAWPPRRAFAPEFPQDEWEPPAITRKVSQSVSELSQYQPGFPRLGPFHTCFESAEPEWPPCYRATSTHDLSWDSNCLAHTPESPPGPLHRPLRGRAFSESHLNLEPASPRGRDRKDLFHAKLDPPHNLKKKGPPPPRPPPPNWEKYRQRRASQHPPDGAGHSSAFAAPVPPRSIADVVRERSQSLTGEQGGRSWGHTARPSAPPGAWPRPEPPGLLHRTPGPDVGNTEICRVTGAGEKRPKAKQPWEMEEQPQRLVRNQEQGCAGPHGVVERVSCQGSWPQPRRVDSEELLWDHSLANILAPLAPLGTATEVRGELLVAGERQAWRERLQQDWRLEALAQDRQGFEPISPPPGSVANSSSFPVHYSAAASKAEPLSKVTALPEVVEGSSEDEEEEVDHELVEKKMQLIESLSRKLAVLQEAQRGLQEDISANGALGEDVSARLQALCTPGEFDKYRLFVGDLDKVVNLLLSLSGRLARVETALGSLGPHAPAEDKLALREKRRLLVAQLEDAKELKEHVGRREEVVGAMVARYLPAEHLQDYQHFVKMKSALIAEQRELEEKIKLGQEQLRCLRESLGQASKCC